MKYDKQMYILVTEMFTNGQKLLVDWSIILNVNDLKAIGE